MPTSEAGGAGAEPWADRCLVVAEVAQSHDGSLGLAHAFIDAAARAGAGAVKFQTHLAAAESTPAEPWRVRFSRQDETRYDYWKRMEFTEAQWRELAAHAAQLDLVFLSSPFSVEAVELLDRIGMAAWKIASGEVANRPLLDAVLATGAPVLLSSGMSPWAELDRSVEQITAAGVPLVVLQCTSDYPTAPHQVGLNLLDELAVRYGQPVGLSDHSGTIYPGLAAATMGAAVVEVHLTLSRDHFGPDVPVSLTPDELAQLVEGVAFLEAARAHPLDKDREAQRLRPMRDLFTRSLVLRRPLAAGTVLTDGDLALKKPGTGLGDDRRHEVIGRAIRLDLPADHLLALDDLQDADDLEIVEGRGMTRKVCVVITARPSYSRVRSALEAIVDHHGLELQLVVAASALLDRYGHAVTQIEADGFRVDERVYTVIEGENPTTMAKSTGLGLIELSSVLDNLRPDVVVSIADRYETLATAIAASYQNIPLAHLQGGEITGSIDEKVRHAVTKLADLHLVSTDLAAERVIRMGEEPNAVHVTGCPSIDLAASILDDPALDFDPFARYGGVGDDVDLSDGYLVVLQHPVTNEHRQARHDVLETLHAVDDVGIPALWFWPNPDAGTDGTSNGIRSFREAAHPQRLHFFKNMAPTDFLRLAYQSQALVGNSSAAIRECSFLGVPAVNIGTRQEGRERGANVVDVGYDRREIAVAIGERVAAGRGAGDPLYGDGKAGPRIAELLAEVPFTTTKRLTY